MYSKTRTYNFDPDELNQRHWLEERTEAWKCWSNSNWKKWVVFSKLHLKVLQDLNLKRASLLDSNPRRSGSYHHAWTNSCLLAFQGLRPILNITELEAHLESSKAATMPTSPRSSSRPEKRWDTRFVNFIIIFCRAKCTKSLLSPLTPPTRVRISAFPHSKKLSKYTCIHKNLWIQRNLCKHKLGILS